MEVNRNDGSTLDGYTWLHKVNSSGLRVEAEIGKTVPGEAEVHLM